MIPMVAFLLSDVILTATAAGNSQSLDTIRDTAESYMRAEAGDSYGNVVIQAGRLDARLALAECASELKASRNAGQKPIGHVLVLIECTDPEPWRLYVPVEVKAFRDVVVSAVPIARGGVVTSSDVTLEARDVSAMPVTPLQDPGQAVQKTARRAIPAGAAITATMLESPRLVRRGEPVKIVASGPNLWISAPGEALQDGMEGESIQVRNSLSKMIIYAVVSAPGTVQVKY
jgi:flagella basal body P-ring formation protein FlgA